MADRYVFSIHSNTKWGVDVGISFFTCWCLNDSNAIALLDVVNQYLPNYAKCSLSKVIREATNYEIPDQSAVLTDVNVVSFALSNDINQTVRRTLKIPLGYIIQGDNTETPGLSQVANALTANVTDGAGLPLNNLIGYSFAPKNIVAGGPVGPRPGPQPGE